MEKSEHNVLEEQNVEIDDHTLTVAAGDKTVSISISAENCSYPTAPAEPVETVTTPEPPAETEAPQKECCGCRKNTVYYTNPKIQKIYVRILSILGFVYAAISFLNAVAGLVNGSRYYIVDFFCCLILCCIGIFIGLYIWPWTDKVARYFGNYFEFARTPLGLGVLFICLGFFLHPVFINDKSYFGVCSALSSIDSIIMFVFGIVTIVFAFV